LRASALWESSSKSACACPAIIKGQLGPLQLGLELLVAPGDLLELDLIAVYADNKGLVDDSATRAAITEVTTD